MNMTHFEDAYMALGGKQLQMDIRGITLWHNIHPEPVPCSGTVLMESQHFRTCKSYVCTLQELALTALVRNTRRFIRDARAHYTFAITAQMNHLLSQDILDWINRSISYCSHCDKYLALNWHNGQEYWAHHGGVYKNWKDRRKRELGY